MTAISQLPAEEIHRLMTTPHAMRLEDVALVHLRAAELLKQMAELKKDAGLYRQIRDITCEETGKSAEQFESDLRAALQDCSAMQDRS